LTEAREKKDKKKAWIVTNSGERVVENSSKIARNSARIGGSFDRNRNFDRP